MKNNIKEYEDCEFSIVIKKEKGELNTIQIYKYNNPIELLTGIASMTEQLISKNVIDENQIKTAIEMGARRAKWKSLDL